MRSHGRGPARTGMQASAAAPGARAPAIMPCVLLGLSLLIADLASAQPPVLEQHDIFVAGADGYHAYRIPALLTCRTGAILAFCEARKNSARDDGDIDLVLRRSEDGGRTWSPMRVVHEEGGDAPITIGNPSPVVDGNTGVIHLLFTRNNQRVFHSLSRDDGLTFSEPVEITDALRRFDFPWTRVGIGPGHGIQLHNGRLLIPVWLNERIRYNYRSAAIYSDDAGVTWRAGGLVGPEAGDSNECMLLERADGSVVINMRATGSKHRSVGVSHDGGLSWSRAEPVRELPDPVCQASLLRIPGAVLFANPASSEKRVNLTVRLSHDEGRTWPVARTLHVGPSGYSDLAQANDGGILCLYESGETRYSERISMARFPVDWLVQGKSLGSGSPRWPLQASRAAILEILEAEEVEKPPPALVRNPCP